MLFILDSSVLIINSEVQGFTSLWPTLLTLTIASETLRSSAFTSTRISSTNSLSLLFSDAGRFWNTILDWMLNSSFLINYVSSSVIWLRAPSSLSFVSSSFLFLAFISSSKSFLTYPIFAHYSYPQRCNKISKICLMSGIISSNIYKRYNTDKKRVKIGQNETCSEPGVCFSVELFNQI